MITQHQTQQTSLLQSEIILVQFHSNLSIYFLLSNLWNNTIVQSNIIIKEYQSVNELGQKVMMKYLFAEELLYLVMTITKTDYLMRTKKDAQQIDVEQFEKIRQNMITRIYNNLTQVGFNAFQSVYFYLKNRKQSTIVKRYNPIALKNEQFSIFQIYKTKQNFKEQKFDELVMLCNAKQNIKKVMKYGRELMKDKNFHLSIISNLDSTSIQIGSEVTTLNVAMK